MCISDRMKYDYKPEKISLPLTIIVPKLLNLIDTDYFKTIDTLQVK